MPGVASMLNKSVPDEKSIHFFYNTQENNLGMRLQDGRAKPSDDQLLFQASTEAMKGIVINPSSMAAAEYLGANVVVGFTKPVLEEGQTDYTKYNVSVISPVYQTLAETETSNTAISLSSSGTTAWVTYVTGPDAKSLSLVECSIDTGEGVTLPGTPALMYGTKLAAYYNTSEELRYVIFQETNKLIVEYCVDTQAPLPLINSNNARKQTPLTVTLVGENTYLYYTDDNNQLCRIIKSNGRWGSSSVMTKPVVDPQSDLTATTANSTNHIFYMAKSAAHYKFTHATDPLLAYVQMEEPQPKD